MIDLNKNYSFNSNLREVPEDKKQMLAYIQTRINELKSIDAPLERTKILGEVGSYLRILEDLDQAENFLNEAMTIIRENGLGIQIWVQNGIRLSHIYQWQGRHELASEHFYNLKKMCESEKEVSEFLHFVLQHIGKLHFQLASFEEALNYFTEALQLREKQGVQSLVDSSKFAITMTKLALEEKREYVTDFEEGCAHKNRSPESSFLGLSPNDMYEILYSTFSLENSIFKYENMNLAETQKVPFVAHAIYFLNTLKKEGFIKATKKGNLSRAFVIEFYHAFLANERYARVPNREEDLRRLTRLKHILSMAGLIKKRGGKFTLTKKGEKLINKENFLELFGILVDVFFNEWNWAYDDGYSELGLIQQSAIFNLHMLNKTAQDWILDEEIGQHFLEAFPMLINDTEPRYCKPEEEVIRTFCIRFLDRACLPLGFLEIKYVGSGFEREKFYRVTPFFKRVFSFNF